MIISIRSIVMCSGGVSVCFRFPAARFAHLGHQLRVAQLYQLVRGQLPPGLRWGTEAIVRAGDAFQPLPRAQVRGKRRSNAHSYSSRKFPLNCAHNSHSHTAASTLPTRRSPSSASHRSTSSGSSSPRPATTNRTRSSCTSTRSTRRATVHVSSSPICSYRLHRRRRQRRPIPSPTC